MDWRSIPQVIALVIGLTSCQTIVQDYGKAKIVTQEYGTIYPNVQCGNNIDTKKAGCDYTLNWSKSW